MDSHSLVSSAGRLRRRPKLQAAANVRQLHRSPTLPQTPVAADEAALATWWSGFNDTKLDGLIERAITNNHDLRIATANLKEARALRRLTTFDLAPTVQANAGYANSLLSKAAALPGVPRDAREVEFYDASFDATWELDFFGRVRRSVQAADAQAAQ